MRLTIPALAAAMFLGACAPQTIISNDQQAVIEAWTAGDAVALAEKECGKRGRWPLLQRQGMTDYWFACNETEEAIAARKKAARDEAIRQAAAMRAAAAPVPAAVTAAIPAIATPKAADPQPVAAAASEAPVKPAQRPKARRGRWVQLGAFRDRATAEKYVAEIRKAHAPVIKGQGVILSEGKTGAGKTFLLARLGPYPRVAEARSACNTLKSRGAACFVASPR
jgi:cell division protein FtsN